MTSIKCEPDEMMENMPSPNCSTERLQVLDKEINDLQTYNTKVESELEKLKAEVAKMQEQLRASQAVS